MQKIFKLLFFNFLFFVFLIIISELIFTIYYKNKINCLYILCDIKYKYHNNLYEPFGKVTYKRDEFGFRGRFKDIDKIDIIVVGGSTTDERLLNLEDTWSEQLQKKINVSEKLNIDIVNAGIDGQSSFGHIWNFNNWFNKIENLNFNYIIFYIGLNESFTGTKFDLNAKDLRFFEKIKIIIKKNNGLIFRLYALYQKYFTDKNINYGINTSDKKFKVNYKFLNNKDIITKENFLNNLEKLYKLSLTYNFTPIFISQRSSRWELKDGKVYTMNEENFYLKEKNISEALMNFCNRKNLICVDLFNNLNLKRSDTYDLMHLNPKGASKVADIVYKKIKDKLIFNK